jgi:hypothetical protein
MSWKDCVDPPELVRVLEDAKGQLKTAWELDQNDSKYPINTAYMLSDIQSRLRSAPNETKQVELRPPRKPTKLDDLVPKKLVERIWEEQHSGTYLDAIRKAALTDYKGQDKSCQVFQSIVRAIEIAYLVNFLGTEFLPKPKISILHRGLQRISILAGLQGQPPRGFAKFLDDLCPCRLENHLGAARKLQSRMAR